MFPKVDALPGTQGQSTVHDGNRYACLRQNTSDVSRHVIGPFQTVGISGVAIRDESFEKIVEVIKDGRIRVFADNERRAGMVNEQSAEPREDSTPCHGLLDLSGDPIQSAIGGCLSPLCLVNHRGIAFTVLPPMTMPYTMLAGEATRRSQVQSRAAAVINVRPDRTSVTLP